MPPQRQVEVFPVLDSMRALAATAVLATHVAFQTGRYSDTLWGTALARFDFGVALFFVLSGFLLSRPYLLAASASLPTPSVRRYLRRRGLRIMPIYLITVVAAMLLMTENAGASAGEWARNLTLTDIYSQGRLPQGLSQMWSLSAEVAFYLVLPLLMVSARRPRHLGNEMRWAGMVLATALVLNTAWVTIALQDGWLPNKALQWLPAYATWFAVGMALAAVQVNESTSLTPHRLSVAARRIGQLPGSCIAVSVALFLIACTPLAGPVLLQLPTTEQALAKNLLYAGAAAALILPGVFADPTRGLGRALSWGPLRHLGHISYGVFCIHLIVLWLVMQWLDLELFSGRGLEVFALTFVLTVIVSELLYWSVERPFMRASSGSRKTVTSSSAKQAATSI